MTSSRHGVGITGGTTLTGRRGCVNRCLQEPTSKQKHASGVRWRPARSPCPDDAVGDARSGGPDGHVARARRPSAPGCGCVRFHRAARKAGPGPAPPRARHACARVRVVMVFHRPARKIGCVPGAHGPRPVRRPRAGPARWRRAGSAEDLRRRLRAALAPWRCERARRGSRAGHCGNGPVLARRPRPGEPRRRLRAMGRKLARGPSAAGPLRCGVAQALSGELRQRCRQWAGTWLVGGPRWRARGGSAWEPRWSRRLRAGPARWRARGGSAGELCRRLRAVGRSWPVGRSRAGSCAVAVRAGSAWELPRSVARHWAGLGPVGRRGRALAGRGTGRPRGWRQGVVPRA